MKNRRRSSSRKKPSDSAEQDGATKEDSSKQTEISGYVKYTNIIYLMLGAIAVAMGVGYFLDRIFQLSFPVFKIIFGFGGVILALYLVFKELNKK